MKKGLLCLILILVMTAGLAPQDLVLAPDDIFIEESMEGGYYIYIRKKPGINSVLFTESTEAGDKKPDTYALRNPEYHPANGDEKRILDGVFLDSPSSRYSLIDSTPSVTPYFDPAFVVFVPYVVEFGYPWSRNGEIQVLDGTYLSIRSFSLPYADYEGEYRDNPFILRVVQKPTYIEEKVLRELRERIENDPGPVLDPDPVIAVDTGPPAVDESIYMPDTVESFREIADRNEGEMIYTLGEQDTVDNLENILENLKGDSIDFVLALDTTLSMKNDIPYLRTSLVPMINKYIAGHEQFRVGLVLYRDYYEDYLTKVIPFQTDMTVIQDQLNRIQVRGGRDIPEAVYEALYDAIHEYSWSAEERVIVLVGDAPPHPRPRGKVTKEIVYNDAALFGVEINTIILPQ